ncbi:MAG: hypothetical protein JWL81_3008 [Verrucomicrobiales bacterium]|nr:hypothetical protein [Rhizobium sp.]MDB6071837.1 hypothetical protein [Verrucomicrobiales bacterium]
MNDPDLSHLFDKARQAQARTDFAAQEYGFETRFTAQLHAQAARGPASQTLIWRAAAGMAAFVGLLAVWFILAQNPQATEDDLTAFWDSGQATYDMEYLN